MARKSKQPKQRRQTRTVGVSISAPVFARLTVTRVLDEDGNPGDWEIVSVREQHRARIAAHAAAHPERLSDSDVEWLAGEWRHAARQPSREERLLAIETMQRREADLTTDEIEALCWAVDCAIAAETDADAASRARHADARAAVAMIVSAHGATP